MILHEVIKASDGPTAGIPAAVGRISRFHAFGDKPGHRKGFAVWLADGDLLLSSAHPRSTFNLRGHGLVRGMIHGG